MRFNAAHPIPYQGSKRQLAAAILSFIEPGRFLRLVEPFVGSAAVTLAAASKKICGAFLIADALLPLMGIWHEILEKPNVIASRYRQIWRSQLDDPRVRYNAIRGEFNRDREPAKLLFLLARCVKNSVRFNPSGEFNQSPDNRRLGVKPETEETEILAAHHLLAGHCQIQCGDFRETLRLATPDDIVYLDPPYQGTSDGRDRRYIRGVKRDEIIEALEQLNKRNVQFILSYDGACGDKAYGETLPAWLGAQKIFVDAGRSSQGTLNGKNLRTMESLYLSAGLCEGINVPEMLHGKEPLRETLLFQMTAR